MDDELFADTSEDTSDAPDDFASLFGAAEAESETGDAEEGETEGTEDEDESDKPSLLAGKFKSQEDLEKAYVELQSLLGKKGAEEAEMRERLARLEGKFESFDDTEEEPPWYEQYPKEKILEAFALDPGRFLHSIVTEALQRSVDPRLGEITEKLSKAEQEDETRAAERATYDWMIRNGVSNEENLAMQKVYEENAELFDSQIGGPNHDKAMSLLRRMAQAELGTGRTAASSAKKRAAAPVLARSGHTGGGREQSPVNSYLEGILQADKQARGAIFQ